MDLKPGQSLRKLSDGSVAVVESRAQVDSKVADAAVEHGSAEADGEETTESAAAIETDVEQHFDEATEQPTVAPDPAPEDPKVAADEGEQRAASSDAQIDQSEGRLAAAQKLVAEDEVVAMLVDVPWAKDAEGRPIPVSYDVESDVLTMTVEHRGADTAYPVVADPWFFIGYGFLWADESSDWVVQWTPWTGYSWFCLCWMDLSALDVDDDPTAVAAYYRPDRGEKGWCALPWRWTKCLDANGLATRALNAAQRKFSRAGLEDGRGDAFRHCYWSAMMTVKWDRSEAKGFGDRHESANRRNGQRASAERMDKHNNSWGREWGDRYGSYATSESKCQWRAEHAHSMEYPGEELWVLKFR